MLLPPSLDEWIGPKHPARFIREFVEQIDLAAEGFEIPNWEEGGVCFCSGVVVERVALWLSAPDSFAAGLGASLRQRLSLYVFKRDASA